MAVTVVFALFSIIAIVAAWRVVTSPNVVRAALALVIVLAAMAPLFILPGAEFVAVVQVLVYLGAVVVLFLFGIMLTRAPMDGLEQSARRRWPAAGVALGLFVALGYSVFQAFGRSTLSPSEPQTTAQVGASLLGDHVLAFEAISVLLLAALIGSLVVARRD